MLKHSLLVIGVIALGALIAYRSYVIPITHDEASTWLNYRHIDLWSCFFEPACWGTANNHWLNSMLLQISANFFGDDIWALRLPNVLAGIAYLVCAALLCGRYIENYALRLAGFLFICAHVYLLDFFSLARGYGLMTCFVLWAVYCMLRYRELHETKWLIACVSALVLSVLSNFTAFIVWASLGLSWLVMTLFSKERGSLLRHGLYWLASAVFMTILLWVPLRTLSSAGEFTWGTSTLELLAVDLVKNLLYGVRYFGDDTFQYVAYILAGLLLITGAAALLAKRKEKKAPVFMMLLMLASTLLVLVIHQKVTGSMLPEGRKSIFLIPLIFGVFATGLGIAANNGTSSFIGIIFSLAFTGHMIRTLPMKSVREWYYDAYYPELFSALYPDENSTDTVSVGCTWIFCPALTYYSKTGEKPISGLEYKHQFTIDTSMQYYFVEVTDTSGMAQHGYDIERRIGPYLLMKSEK